MTDLTARAVAEARRTVHETFTSLPAWDADTARAALAQLEAAIEAHIREQVAQEIEQNIRTWDGMSVSPAERGRGMAHAAAIARNGTKDA